MVAVKEELGLAKTISVSNFESKAQLRDVSGSDGSGVIPAINQIELNPLMHQPELLDHCRDLGIAVQGYCPFAKGRALKHPKILELAAVVVRRTGNTNGALDARAGSCAAAGSQSVSKVGAGVGAAVSQEETVARSWTSPHTMVGAKATRRVPTASDAARLLLRWSIERKKASTIPKTRSPAHLRANLGAFVEGYGGQQGLDDIFDVLDDMNATLRSTWDPSRTA